MRWTRRRMLRGLLAAFAAAALAPFAARTAEARGADGCADWVRGLLPDSVAVGAVARAYLAGHPDAARRSRELDRALLAQPNAAARRGLLAELRRRDFETDTIVVVDGWVLAATEARLCVLARRRLT